MFIHRQHILAFLTGQEEIEGLVQTLNLLTATSSMLICPLYAALPQSAQSLAYSIPPGGTRKIVIATNIAETSLTIPGIQVVIDCGYAKTRYNFKYLI